MNRLALAIMCLAWADAAAQCPPYEKGSIGGDYHDAADARGLPVVEQYHFQPQVEMLLRGQTGPLGGDIGYTLDHFPNHPRALAAMARLALKTKSPHPHGARFSVECYFERATGFRPGDGNVRALYGAYLMAHGRDKDAIVQLEAAVESAPGNAGAWYNLGLLEMRRQRSKEALAAAHKAYGLGFPLPGLRRRLKAAGAWQDPPSLDAVLAH